MATTSAYPIRLDLDAPLEVARWRPLVHWLLAIPHFVVLAFVAIGGLFVGAMRWNTRVTAYVYLMTDVYPPFSLRP